MPAFQVGLYVSGYLREMRQFRLCIHQILLKQAQLGVQPVDSLGQFCRLSNRTLNCNCPEFFFQSWSVDAGDDWRIVAQSLKCSGEFFALRCTFHKAPELRLVVGASLVFGLLHYPVVEELRPWTVFAIVAGLVFGTLAAWSGSLLAPVVAHLLINWLNLKRLAEIEIGDPKLTLP